MKPIRLYRIADYPVKMNCESPFMLRQCGPYEVGEGEVTEGPWLDLGLTSDQRQAGAARGWSPAMVEYNHTFALFLQHVLGRGGFCFHASAVEVDGETVLFSAPSGTGKSTQARLWEEYLGRAHRVVRLNDDKPVLRVQQGRVWAYGSPWSGKHAIHTNAKAPVKALVFLEQATENRIAPVAPREAFDLVFPQTFCVKTDPRQRIRVLELLDPFIRQVPIYRLACTISREAVDLAYETIWKETNHEN